jgi:hypothetical protein
MKYKTPAGEIEYAELTKDGVKDHSPMEFEFLVGDVNWQDYGGTWVSKKLNNGDWDYWLVLEFMNLYNAMGDDTEKNEYYVEIRAVSPEAAGEESIQKALACCGYLDYPESKTAELDDLDKVEALNDYGTFATLWFKQGNNAEELLAEAKQYANACEGMFGFFMDGPKNALGHTGWDFIADDLSIETALNNLKNWGLLTESDIGLEK